MDTPHVIVQQEKPVYAIDTIPAVQAWDAYSAQVRDLIVQKSRGYGNAWQRQGYMGNLARVLSKAARLENMMWRDDEFGPEPPVGGWEEPVMDTLRDLSALAAFMMANLDDANRWGHK